LAGFLVALATACFLLGAELGSVMEIAAAYDEPGIGGLHRNLKCERPQLQQVGDCSGVLG